VVAFVSQLGGQAADVCLDCLDFQFVSALRLLLAQHTDSYVLGKAAQALGKI